MIDDSEFLGTKGSPLLPFLIAMFIVALFILVVTDNADDTEQRSPLITPSTIPYECGVYVTDGPVICWPEGETP